jgi:hypothetical protein
MSSSGSYDTSTGGPISTAKSLEFASNTERDEQLLDELLTWRSQFPSGRRIEVDAQPDGSDQVTIRGTSGNIELEVRLTDRGPVLSFRAAEMQLQTTGRLSLECDQLDVRASRGIRQHTGGDFEQIVSGDAQTWVRGDSVSTARVTTIRSIQGNVEVQANDDVRLNGERVKLNC